MSNFIRENKVKTLLLIVSLATSIFIYDTAHRYYHLTAYQINNDLYVTLEVESSANFFKEKDRNNLSLYIYRDKWRWISGIACFYKNIDIAPPGSMALYDWKILSMEAGIVTLTNNEKEIAVSIEQCF
ncbi:hypothetical protein [Enterobacter sp.]|uniref:hypothetical protein n=1 Tax=Enterobacter sp. TaxID=42895 RepID=UPI00296E2D0E|nr:hypothetical protein [Enterobacter sp.]